MYNRIETKAAADGQTSPLAARRRLLRGWYGERVRHATHDPLNVPLTVFAVVQYDFRLHHEMTRLTKL